MTGDDDRGDDVHRGDDVSRVLRRPESFFELV